VLPALADGPTLLLVLEEVLATRAQGKTPIAVAA
jgi:hypothetical protein